MKLMKKWNRRSGAVTNASDSERGEIDRRTFLRRSGLALGAVALATGALLISGCHPRPPFRPRRLP